MRVFRIIFIFLLIINSATAQTIVEPSPIKWYDIETAMKLYEKNPKPIMIDVYTDWCGWCKYMMKTTFANPNLASYINTYFYPVRFDAETKDTIMFRGKQYINHGKTHDLALYLLDGRPAYPTLVFFDQKLHKYRIPGYQKIKDLEPILVYLQEKVWQNIDLGTFEMAYRLAFGSRYKDELAKVPAGKLPDTTGHVQWLSFEQAWQRNAKELRPFLVFGYVPWCYSCPAMEKLVFSNPQVAKFVNEHFYPIRFNAASTDTIVFQGKKYVSLGKGQPHQLAMMLFRQGFSFPAMIFLDSKFQNIGYVYGFFVPAQVQPILDYFSSGAYKNKSFQEYLAKKEKSAEPTSK